MSALREAQAKRLSLVHDLFGGNSRFVYAYGSAQREVDQLCYDEKEKEWQIP